MHGLNIAMLHVIHRIIGVLASLSHHSNCIFWSHNLHMNIRRQHEYGSKLAGKNCSLSLHEPSSIHDFTSHAHFSHHMLVFLVLRSLSPFTNNDATTATTATVVVAANANLMPSKYTKRALNCTSGGRSLSAATECLISSTKRALCGTPCNAPGSLAFSVFCTIADVSATPQTVPSERMR